MNGVWRRLATDIPALMALVVVALFVGAALLADVLAPHDPLAVDLASNYLPASPAHLLGTDHLGRDTFSRLLLGARVSLTIALVATLAGLLAGATLGLAAAWRRAAEVVMTSASPSMTTLSPTRQTVVSTARALAGSTGCTVTVACTVSPGRTGARNFNCWPM